MVAQQELQHHRRRELRRAAEPARLPRRTRRAQPVDGVVERSRRRRPRRAGSAAAASASLPAICPAAPRTRSPSSRQAVVTASSRRRNRGGRVVGAAVERLARRGEEARHRPAALAGHRLRGRHVDGVDVRPLLPVDLDRDEVRVHLRGRRRVLERLVRHDVAPVAGRVADREQHRHVPPGRLRERRVRPLPPVDGVVGVLEQVGRGRAGEPVGHATSASQRSVLTRRRLSPGSSGGSKLAGTRLRCLVIDRIRKTSATPSRMTTTSPAATPRRTPGPCRAAAPDPARGTAPVGPGTRDRPAPHSRATGYAAARSAPHAAHPGVDAREQVVLGQRRCRRGCAPARSPRWARSRAAGRGAR